MNKAVKVAVGCVAAIVASILGIVKLASDRNRDIKDTEATMERLQSMKEPAEAICSFRAVQDTFGTIFRLIIHNNKILGGTK